MTAIYAKDVCSRCGNYLDDDLKCPECPDCKPHPVEDAFEISVSAEDEDYDPVNKPPHYLVSGGVECIDYMRQILGLQGFIDYCHGNVIKYQHRYKYKGKPVEDMEKAQDYLNKMIEAMKEKHE